jgi:uncharacterized protein (DUF2147 family)
MKDAKSSSQCGQTIIWGLTPVTQNEWAGGAILDPNDGKIYQLPQHTIQTAHACSNLQRHPVVW